jgi:hypothetical protein
MFSAERLPPCTALHYENCRNANCTFIFQKSSNSNHKRSAEIICFLCAAVIRNRKSRNTQGRIIVIDGRQSAPLSGIP